MKFDWKSVIKSYAIIALGSVIYALGFDLFYAPNDVALGGITGLAQVINHVIPALPVGILTIAMNIPLFLLGWKYIGFKLLAGSLVSMLVGSTAIDVIAANFTFAPMDPMLAALCGGAVMGLGIGMVFTQGASTGGTDIVARLLRLKMPWLPLGKLMMLPDGIVLTSAVFAFGKLETGLYGLAALFVCTRVMDTVLYGMDTSKIAYIVSESGRRCPERFWSCPGASRCCRDRAPIPARRQRSSCWPSSRRRSCGSNAWCIRWIPKHL